MYDVCDHMLSHVPGVLIPIWNQNWVGGGGGVGEGTV